MFGIQALWNLSVALAIVPTKGLTLPFVSFGGSSLLVSAAAAGILLNVSRQAPELIPADTPTPPPSTVEKRSSEAGAPAPATEALT